MAQQSLEGPRLALFSALELGLPVSTATMKTQDTQLNLNFRQTNLAEVCTMEYLEHTNSIFDVC